MRHLIVPIICIILLALLLILGKYAEEEPKEEKGIELCNIQVGKNFYHL